VINRTPLDESGAPGCLRPRGCEVKDPRNPSAQHAKIPLLVRQTQQDTAALPLIGRAPGGFSVTGDAVYALAIYRVDRPLQAKLPIRMPMALRRSRATINDASRTFSYARHHCAARRT
jgi:hypothetical protein